jgi:tetratricopeptide (TPR) repeat protein
MKKISLHTFKYTLRDIHTNTENRKFCFVIGAGASFKSGIPTGGQLAEVWFNEIKERYSIDEIDKWVIEEKVNEKDLAAHYGAIYRKRFESDKTLGYECLVQAMKTAKPTFGHFVLAQILTKIEGSCVLTTNFDSLIESSVYQYTDKTPLVCGHESLSGYARPSNIHPLIIKIHRDLLLSPKNDPDEINALDEGWKEPLDNIFSSHIPIVIGYGGNDGSLMEYFEKMNKPSNFFWCGYKRNLPSERVEKLIEQMDGSYIEIEGFDEMMQVLLWVFDEIKPVKEELDRITKSRIDAMTTQLNEMNIQSEKVELDKSEIKKELSAFEYSTLAVNEPDYEKRKAVYLEALEKFPKTGWLWYEFTDFLHYDKKEYSNLEEYYQKALSIDSEDAIINGNYANFLKDIKKDYEKAERYYLKSLSIDSENEHLNGNYANFLKDIKKDYEKAERYYLKSLSIDSENKYINGNYAIFLKDIKKDYEKAERYYLKSLSIDSENEHLNGNYANFLKDIKKDYKNAEKHFLKALSNDSENANNNGNYACFLLVTDRLNESTKYLEKSFHLNNNEHNGLLVELWFYKYAHYFESIDESEKEIELLLKEGVRSIGWNLEQNVQVAIKNGHPNPKKLKELAKRITHLPD